MPLPNKQTSHQTELMGQFRDKMKEELKKEITAELKKEVKEEIMVEWRTRKQNKQSPEPERDSLFETVKDQTVPRVETGQEKQPRDRIDAKTEIIIEKQQQQLPNMMDEFMAELIAKLSKPIPPFDPMAAKNKQPKMECDGPIDSKKEVKVMEDLFDKMTKRILEEFVLEKKGLQEDPKAELKKEPLVEGVKELKEAMFEKIINRQEEATSIESNRPQQKEPLIEYTMKDTKQIKSPELENDFQALMADIHDKQLKTEHAPIFHNLKELEVQKKIQMEKLTKEFRAALALGIRHRQLIKEEQQARQPIIDQESKRVTGLKAAIDSTKQIKEDSHSDPDPDPDPLTKKQMQEQKQEQVEQTGQKYISQEVMNQRKLEIQNGTMLENFRMMSVKLSKNCFRNCLHNLSTSLDARERACISDCMSTYIDSYRLVNRAFVTRIHAEHKKRQEQRQEQLSMSSHQKK